MVILLNIMGKDLEFMDIMPGGFSAKMVLSLILLNSNTITITRHGRTIAKVFVYGRDIVELLK
jgi:hypothetical protein